MTQGKMSKSRVSDDGEPDVEETGGNGVLTEGDVSGIPYTAFSVRRRQVLVIVLGYLALASSLTANIYFPLIDVLAEQYGVSVQAINLTITLFFVFQGVSPSFWSPISDSFGRRPVFLATFTVYTLGSLGLSIANRSYAALLLLRAMQSIGGSAILSISYGVIADTTVHAERGRYLAPMVTTMNIGPCIGPVIGGGAMLSTGDPRWCFRALLIFGASGLLLIGFGLPETNRAVVGNGAVQARGIWRTWAWANTNMKAGEARGEVNEGKTGRGRWVMPNPFASLRLLLLPDMMLALWLAASPYAVWFCVQASTSAVFGGLYGFNELEVGLCFLAGGLGILVGGFAASFLLDHNYRHVARISGFASDADKKTKQKQKQKPAIDVSRFPIERARSRGTIPIIVVSVGAVAGYGWVLTHHRHVHAAVPLLLQAYLGCKCTTVHQIYSALVVDIFPEQPGTAAASNNITRCALAATAVAVLNPLVRVLGYGWMFTLLALVDAAGCVAAVMALRRWGKGWRDRRMRPSGGAEVRATEEAEKTGRVEVVDTEEKAEKDDNVKAD